MNKDAAIQRIKNAMKSQHDLDQRSTIVVSLSDLQCLVSQVESCADLRKTLKEIEIYAHGKLALNE